jgi:hypothetical protein
MYTITLVTSKNALKTVNDRVFTEWDDAKDYLESRVLHDNDYTKTERINHSEVIQTWPTSNGYEEVRYIIEKMAQPLSSDLIGALYAGSIQGLRTDTEPTYNEKIAIKITDIINNGCYVNIELVEGDQEIYRYLTETIGEQWPIWSIERKGDVNWAEYSTMNITKEQIRYYSHGTSEEGEEELSLILTNKDLDKI